MGKDSWPLGRAGCLSFFLVPAVLWIAGQMGTTAALFRDYKTASASVQASRAIPPVITPGIVDLGTLHVGDRCEEAPALEIRNRSDWHLGLSVTANGWLDNGDVTVVPNSIGPGESATVYFTKAAVGPPRTITGEIIVVAAPGPFTTVIALKGEVLNPAVAAQDPDPLPPGCRTTPRRESKATDEGLDPLPDQGTGEEEAGDGDIPEQEEDTSTGLPREAGTPSEDGGSSGENTPEPGGDTPPHGSGGS